MLDLEQIKSLLPQQPRYGERARLAYTRGYFLKAPADLVEPTACYIWNGRAWLRESQTGDISWPLRVP